MLPGLHKFLLAVAAAVALIARPCPAVASCPRPVIRRKSKRALSACGWCGLAYLRRGTATAARTAAVVVRRPRFDARAAQLAHLNVRLG